MKNNVNTRIKKDDMISYYLFLGKINIVFLLSENFYHLSHIRIKENRHTVIFPYGLLFENANLF
jgi:hypothetical protein